MRNATLALSLAAFAAIAAPPAAQAAGQRSFVSGGGVDVATCTLAAPCRSFGYAIGQTLAGGEVIVLDSAGYGPVTISKAITIAAPPGIYAGVSVLSGDGITISAAASDAVVLRGLTITYLDVNFGRGVVANSARFVLVDHCVISRFFQGIAYDATGVDTMAVADTELRANTFGISATGSGQGGHLEVARVQALESNQYGIYLLDVYRTTISDSYIGRNDAGVGTFVDSAATGNSDLVIERTTIVDNTDSGLFSDNLSGGPLAVTNVMNSALAGNLVGIHSGDHSYVRVAGTQVGANGIGLQPSGTGQIVTLGTNMVYGNTTDGAFTGSLSPN